MKNYSKYFFWLLLIVNIVFAVYTLTTWIPAKPSSAETIPEDLLINNNLIKRTVASLSENTKTKQIAIGLVSSTASVCVDNKIADIFKEAKLKLPDAKLILLFPENITDEDIANFKENFKPDFEVMHMDSELSDYWEKVSKKYQTPGIIILGNQNKLFASQNLPKIRKEIDSY